MTTVDKATVASYVDVVLGERPGYLAAAFGQDGYWDAGKYKHHSKNWTERRYAWPAGQQQLHDDITREILTGRVDVYVCPAVRHTNDRSKGSALPPLVCWADMDGPADQQLLATLDPLTVDSGSAGHHHLYVPLSRPVDLGRWNLLQPALRDALGSAADAKIADNDLLRLPGTLNYKTGPPTVVTPVPWSGRMWDPDELAALLGVDLSARVVARATLNGSVPSTLEPAPDPLPALVRWALEHPGTADRSAAHHRLMGACHRAGLTPGQALTLAAGYAPSVEKYGARLAAEVARSWSAVAAAGPRRDKIYDLSRTPPNQADLNGSSSGQQHDGGAPPTAGAEEAPSKATTATTATTSEAFSDSRMAQILTDDVLDGAFRWCKGLGWLRWSGQRWEEATDETVGEVIRQYALDRFEAVIASMRTDPGQPVTAAMNGWKSMLSVGRQRAVLTLARGIVECKAADLDADPDILNNPVGMVNLITGVISPHDPTALITKITKGSYRPGYTHPDWTAALEALPPESRTWYQNRIGQAITGHTAPDGILPILQGTGENGKSLVSTDGVLPALGDYGDVASAKLITANRGAEHSTEMADLRGKRLMIAEEMTESRALDVTAIKRIQDVGTIKARYVHRDNITFQASHSLFATTNYIPRVDETDHGTWRRLAMLTFPYTFRKPGEPLASPADRRGDPELKARIRQGATGQHDAIVTWAVEGALRVATAPATALAVPPSVAAATRAWRGTADRILGYWTERLVADPQACVLTAELLDDFNTWIEANGHKKWSRETFAPKFGGHGETTRHGVESRRVLNPEGLVRRSPEWVPSSPSARLSVWLGVRWRTYADQHKDDSLPEVPESKKTSLREGEAGKFPEALAPLTPRSSESPGNGSCEDHPRPLGFRPTTLMTRVSTYLSTVDGGVPDSQIESAVEGTPEGIRSAVEWLVADGYASRSADSHGAVLHHHQRLYSELGRRSSALAGTNDGVTLPDAPSAENEAGDLAAAELLLIRELGAAPLDGDTWQQLATGYDH